MRKRHLAWGIALAVPLGLWLNNGSLLAPGGQGGPVLLAHRGMAQQFDTRGLRADTCTAARMLPPTHPYLENTLASMRAAFAAGADVVELDVHPTTDGRFAVFHDWTLDCRTEGQGVTREHAMAELRRLDVGHGYTADGGRTFSFRGKGVGLMPSLDEVLAAFPQRRFLIHMKSRDAGEGVKLAAVLQALAPERRRLLMVYGGDAPVAALRGLLPDVQTHSVATLKRCLLAYAALGWSGRAPDACERMLVLVPVNVAPWLWGWPGRFVARMQARGSSVFVLGRYTGGEFSTGIDDAASLAQLPRGFGGGIWTNRIERIAPALGKEGNAALTAAPAAPSAPATPRR